MPQIPTLASLGVIIGVLVVVTVTSLRATRGGDLPEDRKVVAERH